MVALDTENASRKTKVHREWLCRCEWRRRIQEFIVLGVDGEGIIGAISCVCFGELNSLIIGLRTI